MEVSKLDHIVLTVRDIDKTVFFYSKVLGMKKESFAGGRIALRYGTYKINLHKYGSEFEPKAYKPTIGSYDLCFITATPISKAMSHVINCGVEIIEGPLERTGANGRILSFYFRDPDKNLVELSNEI